MTTQVAIEGVGKVELGDEFKDLSPEKQNQIIQDISRQKKAQPDIGQGTAAFEGFKQGMSANFGDEIYGASKASGLPDWLGGFRAPVGAARLGYEALTQPGEATKTYEQAVAEKRDQLRQAQQQYPGTFLAGQVGGSLVIPGGAAAQGATLPARMIRGGLVGGGMAGAAGAGEGENLTERATNAAIQAPIGVGIGAAGVPVVEGIIKGAQPILSPFLNRVRGAFNPEAEASRIITQQVRKGVEADPQLLTPPVSRLTPQEFAATPQAGLVDLGGESTRALADAAAVRDPAARQTLNTFLGNRFEGQGPRITNWLRGAYNYPDVHAQQAALDAAEKATNAANYGAARAKGMAGIMDQELYDLSSAPAMREALKGAIQQAQNKSAPNVSQGVDALSARWVSKDGKPTLELWDLIKRQLDGQIERAKKDRSDFADLTALKNKLVEKLDTAVPEYAAARSGASGFFKAENALEAGQNYVMQNFANSETRRALAKMSPEERKLFQDGFVSRFTETLDKSPDRRSILNQIASSPAAREKIEIALGPGRANELEARLRIEGIEDMARTAVQGNSKTAQRLVDAGLMGGSGALGGAGIYNQDPKEMTIAALMGALAYGKRRVDERVVRQVATMLVSHDPKVITRGAQIIAKNDALFNSLRVADGRIATTGGQQGPAQIVPMLPKFGAAGANDQIENQGPTGQ